MADLPPAFPTPIPNKNTGAFSSFTVSLSDSSGSPLSGRTISLGLVAGTLTGTLGGTTTAVTNGSGIATFGALTNPNVGVYQIHATDTTSGLSSLSNTFVVSDIFVNSGGVSQPVSITAEGVNNAVNEAPTDALKNQIRAAAGKLAYATYSLNSVGSRSDEPDMGTYVYALQFELLEPDTQAGTGEYVTWVGPYGSIALFDSSAEQCHISVQYSPTVAKTTNAASMRVKNATGGTLSRGTMVNLGTTITALPQVTAASSTKGNAVVACDIPDLSTGEVYLPGSVFSLPYGVTANPGDTLYQNVTTGVVQTSSTAVVVGFSLGGGLGYWF